MHNTLRLTHAHNQMNRVSGVDSTSLREVLNDTPTAWMCANVPFLKQTPDIMQTMHWAGYVKPNVITPQGHFVPQLYHKTVWGVSSLKTSSLTQRKRVCMQFELIGISWLSTHPSGKIATTNPPPFSNTHPRYTRWGIPLIDTLCPTTPYSGYSGIVWTPNPSGCMKKDLENNLAQECLASMLQFFKSCKICFQIFKHACKWSGTTVVPYIRLQLWTFSLTVQYTDNIAVFRHPRRYSNFQL